MGIQLQIADSKNVEIMGFYVVKSPYHKTPKYLPFWVKSKSFEKDKYNVITCEYKGWKRSEVDTIYMESTIKDLLEANIILPAERVGTYLMEKKCQELYEEYKFRVKYNL
ncbi:MAG: hypothetical protein ABJH04_07685 [Cyclobacteriaceae bacterium]